MDMEPEKKTQPSKATAPKRSFGLLTASPNFCPMCGDSLFPEKWGWNEGKAQQCMCGFLYQKCDDWHLLAAAECAGGDMALHVEPGTKKEPGTMEERKPTVWDVIEGGK